MLGFNTGQEISWDWGCPAAPSAPIGAEPPLALSLGWLSTQL